MNKMYQKKVKKRTIILASFSLLWLLVVAMRLVQLQVIDHARLKKTVLEQNRLINTISPKRGTLYDRQGNILARSIPSLSVYYVPDKDEPFAEQSKKAQKLGPILKLSARDLRSITQRIKHNSSFIWIKRKISGELTEKVKALQLGGVNFLEENKRFYPHGRLASFILGRVNIDEEGQSGIELKHNSLLSGKPGKRLILRDAKQREYHFEILEAAEPGIDLILTIDETIQYIAEKELRRAVEEKGARWGLVIISEPSTGEILGMAHEPSFDLNHLTSDPQRLDRIPAVHYTFDPGSTFKIVTFASAIESKSIDFSEEFDCSPGVIPVAGKQFRDHKKLGILTFPEVIIHSSNVGTIQIGQRLGERTLYNTIKSFGFGQRTGIDLPAEETGIFRPIKSWSRLSLASLSIGYEISVTAIQMLQAINTVANKGMAVAPRILKRVLISPSEQEPPQSKRVISEDTAQKLCLFLEKVVERGTGTEARIAGYRVIGKTGTAQKFDTASGTYSSSAHIASFMGFVCTENPVFSMVVVIDDPHGPYYGGQVAAPLFRRIASRVLQYLRLSPQEPSPETIIASQLRRIQE